MTYDYILIMPSYDLLMGRSEKVQQMTKLVVKSKTTRVELGSKVFVLDETKAEAALAGKRVINGRETMTFNLLPLKYQWAYEIYRKMKANHWEPEDIPMQRDIEQWRSDTVLTDIDRWI